MNHHHGIPVRDASMNVVDRLGSAPLLSALKRPGLERIDIYPAGRRRCQIGFAWSDGATAIGDLPWNQEAAYAWAMQKGLGRMVKLHTGRAA